MDMFVIQGGTALSGEVCVEGAKNAALPIMAATLAVRGDVQLDQVPDLVDVTTMSLLLRSFGATVHKRDGSTTVINTDSATKAVADYELVRRMRASICVLGPLLARFGKAIVSLPGGCNIGHRPIDLHLRGLAALGADLKIENGYVVAEAGQLKGADVFLGGPFGSTVTGTCNIMVAAALAKGRTTIYSAACEPEVIDLGNFLNTTGARIAGLGTPTIEIDGVDHLKGGVYRVMPDRIEAATFAIAAAATRGNVLIRNAPVNALTSVIDALIGMGVAVKKTEHGLRVCCPNPLNSKDIAALPYPGIPTDTQAQFMALLTTISGTSIIRDSVFPDRFMHASELMRMGASIRRDGAATVVDGGSPLMGTSVMASDLRASAALVIGALAATGETSVRRIYHLDRGYAGLDNKLILLGANVRRVPDNSFAGTLPNPHFPTDTASASKLQAQSSPLNDHRSV